jgi:UDP-N-acetylglucosamine 2-epimerase (non-hydrolysing)
MKISFIFGTRPEAIKLAPVIIAARATDGLEPHICLTGQHRSMVAQVLEVFSIEPDTDLQLMRADQSLAEFSSRALTAVDSYLSDEQPDMVLVQGDTSTVLCAALAAFYRRIPVGHIEAGLRTGNPYSPFPEEMNRVLTTQIAELHFAPTQSAREHLIAEGVAPRKINVTGNTIVDALQLATKIIQQNPPNVDGLPAEIMDPGSEKRLVLITGHRRESFGAEFENICNAVLSLARKYPDVAFVYPAHLNPNVQEPAHRILGEQGNIHLLKPLGYLSFVALMNRATIVLTDSGGIQEEAPSLGKPVLVMRNSTERPEGIQSGTAKLVGTSRSGIVDAVSSLLDDEREYSNMARAVNHYGDGRASERVTKVIKTFASYKKGLCFA